MYHEVKAVNGSREWSSKMAGEMVSYELTIVDGEGLTADVYTNRKATSSAPHVGERIHGYIDTDKMGNLKLTKTQEPEGATPHHQSAPKPSSSAPVGNNDTQMQIIRQSSLKAAVDVCIANKLEKDTVNPTDVIKLAEVFADYAANGVSKNVDELTADEIIEAMGGK